MFLAMLLTMSCAGPVQREPGPIQQPGEIPKTASKDAQEIALDFLRNCPTYRFDGIDGSIKLIYARLATNPLGGASSSSVFGFEFQCRQAGYGNRAGRILAQVITRHEAEISVEQGQVTSAIFDGQWDELKQEPS
jgi:hypothetical protein